ncbi:MAG: helix-turn-helix domain-containing protein [Candidatus Odinarchaeia archaeon]
MITKEIFQHMAMPELNISCLALCTLGLQDYEFETYLILLREGPKTVNELMKIMNKSRATAQRILGQLLSKGIVYRHKKTFLNGGYIYRYHAIPVEKFRDKMKKNLEEWYRRSIEIIENMSI